MVLDDIFYRKKDSANAPKPTADELPLDSQLASPVDRAAAVVADMVIFVPFLSLIVAPFRRYALEAQILGHHDSWLQTIVSATASTALAVVLYQTFFISIWGATPGKRVMRLKVVSLWGNGRKPRPMEAFIRSVTWCFEILLAGLPLAAVFGNEKRRPLHDRAADTVVIVDPNGGRQPAGPPTLPELSIASGFQAAALTVISMSLFSQLLRPLTASTDELVADLESEGKLCQEVGDAHSEWSAGPSRLSVALTLFAAQSLTEDCLRQEAEFSLWRNEEKPLAYLAKALTEGEDEKLQDKYFSKACANGTGKDEACQGVSFLRAVDKLEEVVQTDAKSADDKVAETDSETQLAQIIGSLKNESSAFMKVWAIRHLMEAHRYAGAVQLIDEIAPQKKLGPFLARERAKALWQMGEIESSRAALRTSANLLGPASRMELARWFCSQETLGGQCTDASRVPCALMSDTLNHMPDLMAIPGAAATFVRAELCRNDGRLTEDLAKDLGEKISDKNGKDFVQALGLLASNERAEGIRELKKIASGRDDDDPFYLEANLQLAELARSVKELSPIRKRWSHLSARSDSWRGLGLKIMAKLGTFGIWEDALQVGLKIVEPTYLDRRLYRSLVVASFRAGHEQMAIGFLERLDQLSHPDQEPGDLSPGLRAPASSPEKSAENLTDKLTDKPADEFERIVSELREKRRGGS